MPGTLQSSECTLFDKHATLNHLAAFEMMTLAPNPHPFAHKCVAFVLCARTVSL
jgi:hypothetical protein